MNNLWTTSTTAWTTAKATGTTLTPLPPSCTCRPSARPVPHAAVRNAALGAASQARCPSGTEGSLLRAEVGAAVTRPASPCRYLRLYLLGASFKPDVAGCACILNCGVGHSGDAGGGSGCCAETSAELVFGLLRRNNLFTVSQGSYRTVLYRGIGYSPSVASSV